MGSLEILIMTLHATSAHNPSIFTEKKRERDGREDLYSNQLYDWAVNRKNKTGDKGLDRKRGNA